MAHFVVENLSFAYPGAPRRALDEVNLSIEKGQYITVCGKSGCGKTTLLRHLKSVLTPHGERSGRVLFCGRPLDEVSQREQAASIGFVMQDPDAQVVTDKVWHELAFGLESLGVDQQTMRLRVAEMASYFGIQNWFHKDVGQLSGGQKQLLNLASIMAMQPSVLILDEPTSQLDPLAAADFLNTVRKINIELGTTIILTEHRLEEVYPAADRVIVMDAGRIVADGDPRAVGAFLHDSTHDLMAALPAPMRIFYGVADVGEAGACPLTVREGRAWLSVRCAGAEAPACVSPDGAGVRGGAAAGAAGVRGGAAAGAAAARHAAEAAKPVALSVKDLWFRYERDVPDVLRGACLDIPQGGVHAIVGGNGTGKSTLLKAMCGVVKPQRGTVRVMGRKLKEWSRRDLFQGCMAMLPQDPQNLFVKKTVREDLAEMLDGQRLDATARSERILEVARTCDIVEQLDAHPYDLSGGEQQRAALAKVLLTDPQIILLDEPTKGIDSFFKLKLAEVFAELASRGVTIIMVSHDVEFCAAHADSVSMFFDGSVVSTSTPRRFFSQNSFYTTAANRMSRHVFSDAVTDEDVIERCVAR